ncbi:MAG: alpha/beta hydrolase [Desulfitobacteriia bacterium]|jgi:acetyl esterase/lipase
MDKKLLEEKIEELELPDERIHPDLRPFLSVFPSMGASKEIVKASRDMPPMMPPAAKNKAVNIEERFIPGPEGGPEVRVKIFTPVERKGVVGGLLWIHGGGYVYPIIDMDDGRCMSFALESNCVVVSVDYRVAPENPYPAPLEDCYAALTWFSENAEELGVDRSRIAVAGGSAGGGLTIALCLLARDRKGPEIVFQMPLCPMIDDRHITPSSFEITDPRFWNRQSNIYCWSAYLGNISDDEVPIYAAPARAQDLTDLPPAYLFVGGIDMFRDETIEFAARLARAGVATELHVFPGCFHGFEILEKAGISQRANEELIRVLKSALGDKK